MGAGRRARRGRVHGGRAADLPAVSRGGTRRGRVGRCCGLVPRSRSQMAQWRGRARLLGGRSRRCRTTRMGGEAARGRHLTRRAARGVLKRAVKCVEHWICRQGHLPTIHTFALSYTSQLINRVRVSAWRILALN